MVRMMAVDRTANNRRLEEACLRAFEREIARIVEDEFETLCASHPKQFGEIEIPYIGGRFNPNAPHAWVVNLARKALTARCWVGRQNPCCRLPPLPLKVEAIETLQNNADSLLAQWGWYAGLLRKSPWDLRQAMTFEWMCDIHRRTGAKFGGGGELSADRRGFLINAACRARERRPGV